MRGLSYAAISDYAAVGEVSGDPGRAKHMAADRRGDAGRRGAAADHTPGVGLVHGEIGQRIGFVPAGGAEQSALAVLGDAGGVDEARNASASA